MTKRFENIADGVGSQRPAINLDDIADGDLVVSASGLEQLVVITPPAEPSRRVAVETLQIIGWRLRDGRLVPIALDADGVDPTQRDGGWPLIRLQNGRCRELTDDGATWPSLESAVRSFKKRSRCGRLATAHQPHSVRCREPSWSRHYPEIDLLLEKGHLWPVPVQDDDGSLRLRCGELPVADHDQRWDRYRMAYLMMALQVGYRPAAPGDGCGGIDLSDEQLWCPEQLELEARKYAQRFLRCDDAMEYPIGCPDFRHNRSFCWIIEAATLLCSPKPAVAARLLRMALKELQYQDR